MTRQRMTQHWNDHRGVRPGRGFSLVELLVSMAVAALLLTGVLAAFNLNSRLARVQTHVADMQQSSRISQYEITRFARMTGRGGLRDRLFWNNASETFEALAFELRSNVDPGTKIGDDNSPEVAGRTDILTLRGVFTAPYYQISPANGSIDPTANTGRIRINALSPSGIDQNLAPLADAVRAAEGGVTDAIVLTSSVGTDYVVLELFGGEVETGGGGDVFVEVDWRQVGGRADSYLALAHNPGVFPAGMKHVVYLGLLEEYRYYIRETGDGPNPLSRARYYPGTDDPYADERDNEREDIADNIIDLQVALGLDVDGDGLFDDVNEWLGDDITDDPAAAQWTENQVEPFYLRINTLARTNRPDPKYVDPAIDWIENREYDETPGTPPNAEVEDRSYRRKLLQNVVDLRNLG